MATISACAVESCCSFHKLRPRASASPPRTITGAEIVRIVTKSRFLKREPHEFFVLGRRRGFRSPGESRTRDGQGERAECEHRNIPPTLIPRRAVQALSLVHRFRLFAAAGWRTPHDVARLCVGRA
jgi:hypothetical protein